MTNVNITTKQLRSFLYDNLTDLLWKNLHPKDKREETRKDTAVYQQSQTPILSKVPEIYHFFTHPFSSRNAGHTLS